MEIMLDSFATAGVLFLNMVCIWLLNSEVYLRAATTRVKVIVWLVTALAIWRVWL